jgi:hypothetical protein
MKNVGDIEFNEHIDDQDFKVCDEEHVPQYYSFENSGVKNHKQDLIEFFKSGYINHNYEAESGYITIRFIVNCEGKAGRVRIQEMDMDYKPKVFTTALSKQLLLLTKSYDKWEIAENQKKKFDYYYYLTFKVVQGNIILIKP